MLAVAADDIFPKGKGLKFSSRTNSTLPVRYARQIHSRNVALLPARSVLNTRQERILHIALVLLAKILNDRDHSVRGAITPIHGELQFLGRNVRERLNRKCLIGFAAI